MVLDMIAEMKTAKAVDATIIDRNDVWRILDQGSKYLDKRYYEPAMIMAEVVTRRYS